jgi:hypothetical protein
MRAALRSPLTDGRSSERRLERGDAVNERGAEPPELVVHDLDVKRWLGPVLLGLATKIVPGGDAVPPN